MNKTTVGCLTAALVVALVISIGFNVIQFVALVGESVVSLTEPKERLREKEELPGQAGSKDKIIHIDLEGIITSMELGGLFGGGPDMVARIKDSLRQAVEDGNVKAIVLRVNSPGGEVTASDIIYAAVKEAAKKKPVVVYMDSLAASGGYYVACGATKVIASETTLTASIGVIMESFSYHDLFGKVGLEMKAFTSGPYKDTLSGGRPMRSDEVIYVQNLVNTMYDRFLGIVSEARKVPKDILRATVADGRIVTGRQALEAKLVDQIGYVEDAYALARQLGKAPGASIIKYRSSPSFFGALGLAQSQADKAAPAKIELDITGGALPRLQPGMLYYLPSAFAVRPN
ncbi:MAG TPA: signal peptide peptidase SppA [Prosthecobacter sp.]|nr:signal peptide peptidase SppA [Prosthecobacter sp.]